MFDDQSPQSQPALRKQTNTYIMDQQNAAEMARLLQQGRLLTDVMSGLFPDALDLSRVHDVLDIACGPGGWVLDVARTYPQMQVTGFDIDRMLVEYARAQAVAYHLGNVSFKTMDATKTLKFPTASFDFINARLLVGFMLPQKWPRLLQECQRLLRPGGIIRLTECEVAISSSPASEQLYGMLTHALKLAGQSFHPDGRVAGITPVLRRLLRDAGCQHITHTAYAVDFSFGSEAYSSGYEDFQAAFKLIQPFFVRMGVATEDEIESLYQQALLEMQQADFCAIWYYLSVWGMKPEASSQ
jgi:ubiquinone/menaquinone biosynthesis C-methylase UbiE